MKKIERDGCEFFAPKCVPLVDDKEREFYKQLAARGHEIGMHTPSDTCNVRQDVIRAFEFFKTTFGQYPTVYAEHKVSTKKDAQAREGSKVESLYYNTDLLNSYGPWVWIVRCLGRAAQSPSSVLRYTCRQRFAFQRSGGEAIRHREGVSENREVERRRWRWFFGLVFRGTYRRS